MGRMGSITLHGQFSLSGSRLSSPPGSMILQVETLLRSGNASCRNRRTLTNVQLVQIETNDGYQHLRLSIPFGDLSRKGSRHILPFPTPLQISLSAGKSGGFNERETLSAPPPTDPTPRHVKIVIPGCWRSRFQRGPICSNLRWR